MRVQDVRGWGLITQESTLIDVRVRNLSPVVRTTLEGFSVQNWKRQTQNTRSSRFYLGAELLYTLNVLG